ncbi:hypothetical protein KSP40_PGU001380 [Platanthera guangdongensis]|uniref:Uncharacterized protein n=1 Tax=Platanthera guangdongensis TaxID=2320717 RepID=A0ABR2LIN3_9ASPA
MFIKRFHAWLKLEKQNSICLKKLRQQEPPDERLQEAGIELEMEQEIMTMMMASTMSAMVGGGRSLAPASKGVAG